MKTKCSHREMEDADSITTITAQRHGSEQTCADGFDLDTPNETITTPKAAIETSLTDENHSTYDGNDGQSYLTENGDEEPPLSYTPGDEHARDYKQTQGRVPLAASISEAEEQQFQQPETSCEMTMKNPTFKFWEGHCKQRSRTNDLDWSHPRWYENTRKISQGSCRTITWLAIIALMIMILAVRYFGDSCIWTRPLHQDPFPQIAVPAFEIPVRNITRHETYKSIHGTFRVRDSLALSTTTGSIHATIDLVPLNPELPTEDRSKFKNPLRPVNIDISTTTGSVHIGFTSQSRINAYARSLFITIKTQTGSMHATDILVGNGGITELSTDTGGMHPSFVVLGAGPYDPISHLITRTGAKSQHVTVRALEGGSEKQATLVALRGDHRSTASGSLHVTYPHTWEGKVEGVARTGSVKIKGRDMTCRSERDGWAGKKKVCYRSRYDSDERTLETTIFLASEGFGSIHFKA